MASNIKNQKGANRTFLNIAAEVSYAAYLGNQIQYSLVGEMGSLFAVSEPDRDPVVVGESVFVSFRNQDVRLVK